MIKYISFLLILLVFIFSNPSIVLANENNYYANCNVRGSTTLYDLKKDNWFTTNAEDSEIRTLPASTFKIFHSLIALDTGATKPGELFKWDGVERAFAVWNQDTVFRDAFKNSTVWVYEVLAQRISKDTYKRYLNWAEYAGNKDIDHGKDGNFWVYGDWGISPKEQINMLIKLYRNQLPFSRASMDVVKDFMREDDGIFGKTGWTEKDGNHIGWWIGYAGTGDDIIFFATRLLKSTDEDMGDFLSCRKTITHQVIRDYQDSKLQ